MIVILIYIYLLFIHLCIDHDCYSDLSLLFRDLFIYLFIVIVILTSRFCFMIDNYRYYCIVYLKLLLLLSMSGERA